jgi:hypothetical protein
MVWMVSRAGLSCYRKILDRWKGASMAEETLLELTLFNRVTFHDIVNLNDKFFLLARDHLSAFDVILPSWILGKGKI